MLTALMLAAVVAQSPAAMGAPASKTLPSGQCFDSRAWRGWKSPSPDVLLIGVGGRDVYRIDLLPSARLDSPGNFLVSITRGSTRVCGTLDLDLKVSDRLGPAIGLFPNAIRKLTPEEVAALPPKDRP